MKLVLLLALLAGCATPPVDEPKDEPKEAPVCLAAEQVAQCESEGGCAFVTKEKVRQALQAAFEKGRVAGVKEAGDACWANTSGREL